ncbi:hypothetical protein Csa_017666 [Cucumis sativus]|uniref:Uncharacterized protein n=1 Tax=Cucumis sativus TaxID=3659 RepID=A0A0A0LW87_CUCSA|nr:hypothetical protein Csa_017666 [Cucumis sativus]
MGEGYSKARIRNSFEDELKVHKHESVRRQVSKNTTIGNFGREKLLNLGLSISLLKIKKRLIKFVQHQGSKVKSLVGLDQMKIDLRRHLKR